ncbi:MAG: AAA family ATPase, partial [Candidatus Thorarchaeota archaeon]|nr:AAA family ATPase [Candidatus Thorarchaeota archaeon]
ESEDLQERIDTVITDLNKAGEHLFKDSHFKTEFEKLQLALSNLSLIGQNPDSIDLEVYGLSNRRILQNFALVFKSDESAKHIPLRYQGYGAQNAMLITAILQLISANLEKNLIVAFEEPEQNLEPYFQRLLIKRITALTKERDKHLSSQVLMSTHSRDVVEMFPLKNVKIVNADNAFTEHKVISIREETKDPEWKNFLNRLESRNKDEVVNGFFAKAVLLVEGSAEKGALPIFSRHIEKGFDEFGIEIICCGGKGEMLKYARYFKDISIKVFSLCDNDLSSQSNDKDFREIAKKSALALRWSKNFETALLSSKKFQQKFFEVCQKEFRWPHEREIFFRDTFCAEEKGKAVNETLKSFYELRAYTNVNLDNLSPEELAPLLKKEGLLSEYQQLFLHRHCSSVRVARFLAETICSEIGEIPAAIRRFFGVISEYQYGKISNLKKGDFIKSESLKLGQVVLSSPLAVQLC